MIIHVGGVFDGVEHDASTVAAVVREVPVHRATERVRVNLMDPVDHDDRIVDARQLGLGELEAVELRRPASLESRQKTRGRKDARIVIQPEPFAKPQMAEDVAQAAPDLDHGFSIRVRPRVEVPDDVRGVPLAGVADVPRIEAVDPPQQASLETLKSAPDVHGT